ncbi:hypothetical protein PIB30_075108 [Stylosanthes scabra]|uniref:Uncharacterized protein n=1 Tax=Stylosanthes scabra TaxID=79078 RepID=A0ABU6VNB9_9FABA|nr:hypothetical protein [Stylosanthes scabra]
MEPNFSSTKSPRTLTPRTLISFPQPQPSPSPPFQTEPVVVPHCSLNAPFSPPSLPFEVAFVASHAVSCLTVVPSSPPLSSPSPSSTPLPAQELMGHYPCFGHRKNKEEKLKSQLEQDSKCSLILLAYEALAKLESAVNTLKSLAIVAMGAL